MHIIKKTWVKVLLALVIIIILGWKQIISSIFVLSAHFQCNQGSPDTHFCHLTPTAIEIPKNSQPKNQNWSGMSFYLPNQKEFIVKDNEQHLTLERQRDGKRIGVLTISDGYKYQLAKNLDTIDLGTSATTPGEVGYFQRKSNESVVNLLAQDPSHFQFLEMMLNSQPSIKNYFGSAKQKNQTATLLAEKQLNAMGMSSVQTFKNENIQGFILLSNRESRVWQIYIFNTSDLSQNNSLTAVGLSEEEVLAILGSFAYTE